MAPRYRPQRLARYNRLIALHFSPVEAREFSKLERDYPALRKMVRQRAAQYGVVTRRANREGWSSAKRQREWVSYLSRFYSQGRYKVKRDKKTGDTTVVVRPWVVTKDVHGKKTTPAPSPWEWYDNVFQRLPDEQKWDTPRSHRQRTPQVDIQMDRVQKQRWIAELNRSIAAARKAGDDARVRQLEEQRRSIRRM